MGVVNKILTVIYPLRVQLFRKASYLSDAIRGIDMQRPISVQELGLNAEQSNHYGTSRGILFNSMLKSLPISDKDSILDFGCGKGGALIWFAKFPFKDIEGVELSKELCDIAIVNLKHLKIKAKVYNENALDFSDLDRFNFFYFYNPFPAVIMNEVVENIQKSYVNFERQIILIYKNPKHPETFEKYFHRIETVASARTDGKIHEIYSTNKNLKLKKPLYFNICEKMQMLKIY